MRDPNRIDRILERLREVWTEHPDYRLGQLLVNFVRPNEPCPEVFYIEDELLEQKMDDFATKMGERNPLRYLKQHRDETRGDEHAGWGHSWQYVEIDPTNCILRQIEQYDDGPTLGYSRKHAKDEFGGLNDQPFIELDSCEIISAEEFYSVWNTRSNL